MSVKVVVGEGEPVQAALMRLRKETHYAYRRKWSKTRPGAYEKPSYRKRKGETLRYRNARMAELGLLKSPRISATVHFDPNMLLSREEVYQGKRPPFKPRRRWWGDD